MQVVVQKLPKSTIKLTITVEEEKVKEAVAQVFSSVVKNAEIDGFRKGHAPEDLVKDKVDAEKLESEVISNLIKTYYPQALKEQNISPIISPRIQIESFDKEKAFTFTAETAVRPEVTIGDYKKAIKDVYEGRKAEIALATPHISPNDSNPVARDDGHNDVHLTPSDVIGAITSVTTVELPEIVVDEEVNKMLSRLVGQIQPLNLSMEDYLKSINKTGDDLKHEYAEIAGKNIVGEIALVELVDKEDVKVEESEIDNTINAIGDEKLKARYKTNPMEKGYVRSIIAKNKLIWKLISDVEGGEVKTESKTSEDSNTTAANSDDKENQDGKS